MIIKSRDEIKHSEREGGKEEGERVKVLELEVEKGTGRETETEGGGLTDVRRHSCFGLCYHPRIRWKLCLSK